MARVGGICRIPRAVSVSVCDGLGFSHQLCERLVAEGAADPGWRGLATLDAATRMVTASSVSGGLRRGEDAGSVLRTLMERAHAPPATRRSSG